MQGSSFFGKAKGTDAAGHDALGNLTYFWTSTDGTRTKLYSSRVSAAGAWSPITRVDSENLGTGSTINLGQQGAAADASGNVTAVWAQSDGVARRDVWANRADASGAWAGAQNLTSVLPAGATGVQDMAFEGSPGTAPLLVGTSSNGSFLSLWASDMR